jgi:hypothetical protein
MAFGGVSCPGEVGRNRGGANQHSLAEMQALPTNLKTKYLDNYYKIFQMQK